ncbi:hypothetical protein JHK87_051236 [Glycine soja]|nr:hypothetical protein JHK87_051236 [Glycine soja]
MSSDEASITTEEQNESNIIDTSMSPNNLESGTTTDDTEVVAQQQLASLFGHHRITDDTEVVGQQQPDSPIHDTDLWMRWLERYRRVRLEHYRGTTTDDTEVVAQQQLASDDTEVVAQQQLASLFGHHRITDDTEVVGQQQPDSPIHDTDLWMRWLERYRRVSNDLWMRLEHYRGTTTDDTEVVAQQQLASDDTEVVAQQQLASLFGHHRRQTQRLPMERHRRYPPNDVHGRWIVPPGNPSSLMSFKEAVVSNARRIPLHSLLILLFACVAIMKYLAKELSSQFLLESVNYPAATQAPVSLGEAFQGFLTEIAYETAMMMVFLLAFLVSCPRPLFGVAMVATSFLGLFLYIPDLVGKAPGIVVTCGFFTMPLICFTTIVAFVLTLVFVFLAVFFVYFIYGCARGAGISTGGELEVAMQDSPVDVEEGEVN